MDVREKLVELLANYFDIGDSYAYNLTRVKFAFACGTMGFDDFEEFDEETVEDIATHLIANGATVQEWISTDERMPTEDDSTDGYVAVVYAGVDGVKTRTISLVDVVISHPDLYDYWMPLNLPQPPKGE